MDTHLRRGYLFEMRRGGCIGEQEAAEDDNTASSTGRADAKQVGPDPSRQAIIRSYSLRSRKELARPSSCRWARMALRESVAKRGWFRRRTEEQCRYWWVSCAWRRSQGHDDFSSWRRASSEEVANERQHRQLLRTQGR